MKNRQKYWEKHKEVEKDWRGLKRQTRRSCVAGKRANAWVNVEMSETQWCIWQKNAVHCMCNRESGSPRKLAGRWRIKCLRRKTGNVSTLLWVWVYVCVLHVCFMLEVWIYVKACSKPLRTNCFINILDTLLYSNALNALKALICACICVGPHAWHCIYCIIQSGGKGRREGEYLSCMVWQTK